MIHIKKFDDLIYVYNNHKRMAYETKNLSDRGLGFGSWIRKRLIGNIDLSQSNDAICESINRINDVNWMRQKPIYFRDESIKYFKKLGELGRPTKYLDYEEQHFIDFVGAQKLDLYYKVSTYDYIREYIHVPRCNTASSSDPSTWPAVEQIDRQTPHFSCYKDFPLSSMLHRMYLHCKLHFYNEQVAKYLFWDRDKKDPYSPHDNRISVHNKAVKQLEKSMTKFSIQKLTDIQQQLLRPIKSKTTVILNKTSTGEYLFVFGNILTLYKFGMGEPYWLSTTLYDAIVYNHQLIHREVVDLFVNCYSFDDMFFSSHFHDYEYGIHKKYIDGLLSNIHWFHEQPPCIYEGDAYPSFIETVQNMRQDGIIQPSILEPEMNQQHPDWNQNIQWGKVLTGIGIICVGIGCVVTGCSIPFDVTTIFRGGGN